jgi:hypothetical protein
MWMARKRSLIGGLVLLLVLLNAPAAHASMAARTSLVTNSIGVTKMVLKLSSDTAVAAAGRPTGVSVVGGGVTYQLQRVTGVAMTATKLGTWKSVGFTVADDQDLLKLVGTQVTVKVRSRSGTGQFGSRVTTRNTMGRAANDQMTGFIDGAAFRDFSSSGSERYDLHLCTDGRTRYYHDFNSEFGSVTTEKFGQPWSVTDSLITPDRSYGRAFVEVTFTERNDFDSGGSQINEPFRTLIESSEGTWYWAGDEAQTLLADCDPSF